MPATATDNRSHPKSGALRSGRKASTQGKGHDYSPNMLHKSRNTTIGGGEQAAPAFDRLIHELLDELRREQGATQAPQLQSIVTSDLGAGRFLVTVLAE